MESLFRSPIKESLFWSSKESVVRTSSRESLNQLDLDCPAATFDPPSDMESEAEDTPGSSDGLNREQLLQRLRRMERSLSSYRGKYSEVGAGFGSRSHTLPLGLFFLTYCPSPDLVLVPGAGGLSVVQMPFSRLTFRDMVCSLVFTFSAVSMDT